MSGNNNLRLSSVRSFTQPFRPFDNNTAMMGEVALKSKQKRFEGSLRPKHKISMEKAYPLMEK